MLKKLLVTSVVLIGAQICSASSDLASMHEKLIKFYGYQRAGLKSGSCHNLNSGFTNAAHGGDKYQNSQLDGGWYDAGDYIKFGMNLAYSTYCLLKGYDAFPSGYSNKYSWDYGAADDIPDILNEVKFATDYICKAVINENTIVLDVGKGDEHRYWGKATSPGRGDGEITLCSGADIPAEYAACLALMSTLYRKYDAKYADDCLAKAKTAFAFAKKKIAAGGDNNLYCRPQDGGFYDYNKENNQYIRSINDKMVAAGVELLRATNGESPVYEEWASKAIPNFYNCISYSYIGPLASFETWRQDIGGRNGSLAANAGFITTKLKTSGMFNKVFQNSGWGTARDVGAAAFTYGLAYATTSSQDTRDLYLSRVKDHINWMTGTNSLSQSFICGVGSKPPTSIHYRTTNYGAVPGAVVSGPDDAGNWSNDGAQYKYTEVAIDYNAGVIGAVAFLRAISSDDPNEIKVNTAFTADPKENVDFLKNSVKFSGVFSKSVKWTIDIIGSYGSKTITKTGTSISETWDGSADKGAFLGGETVRAKLTVDGNIAVYDLLKAGSQSIFISNNKPLPKKDGDVVVDDFNDKDTISKTGGLWEACGTYTSSLQKSKRSITTGDSPELLFSGFDNSTAVTTWSGVKAYFDKDKKPVALGDVKSIYFSARTDKKDVLINLSVELEQSTITDSAYYSAIIPVKQAKNYYRIDIADMKQPEWKTADKPLDLTQITSLRFVAYDSLSSFKVYLDDVAIEGLSLKTSMIFSKHMQPTFNQMVTANSFNITLPQSCNGVLDLTVFDISGKIALRKMFNTTGENNFSFPVSSLPSGTYTVISRLNGEKLSEGVKIIRARR